VKGERAVTLVLLALLALWCVLAVTAFVEPHFGEYVDSAIYVLTAQSLRAGQGYTYLDQPFFVRPPGFAWMLQPLVGLPLDHAALNRFLQATAVAAFVAVALVLRRLHGALVGTLVALLFAISRPSVQSFDKLFAEFSFMAAFFGALWLLTPAPGEGRVGWRRGVAGAVLLSASCWLRSVGLLALPPLALSGVLRKDGRRWQGPALAALALALHLPWMLWAREAASHAPRPATQMLMFDYPTALLRSDPGDPGSPLLDAAGWVQRIQENTVAIASSLPNALLGIESGSSRQLEVDDVGVRDRPKPEPGPLSWIVAAAVAAAMLHALWGRRSLLDWYGAASIAMLLAYFTFTDRLLLPLFPVVLSALFFSAERLAARVPLPQRARALARATALAALAAGLAVVVYLHWARDRVGPDFKQQNSVTDGFTAEWLIKHTSPDARVLHERGPILSILSGRRAYTYRNRPGGWPGGPEVDWIVVGPFPSPIEPAVAMAANKRVDLTVRWKPDQPPMVVRIYRMTDAGAPR
jgi:hypothetical protein